MKFSKKLQKTMYATAQQMMYSPQMQYNTFVRPFYYYTTLPPNYTPQMPSYYKQWSCKSTPKVYNPPATKFCKFIPFDHPPEMAGQLIGKGANVFNCITNQSGTKYIWLNNDSKQIEIYGDTMEGIETATLKIYQRINLIISNDSI